MACPPTHHSIHTTTTIATATRTILLLPIPLQPPTKLQRNNSSLRKPSRKTSLDMMSHHLYDKYNCPVKKPMRKASLDMCCSYNNTMQSMPCCHNCQKMHAPGMYTCQQQRRSMSLLNLLFRRNGQRQPPKTGTCQM